MVFGVSQGHEDAQLYRSKFVLERIMAQHGSAASRPHGLDSHTWRIVRQALALPGLAGQLVEGSGLIVWLARLACSSGGAHLSSNDTPGGAAGTDRRDGSGSRGDDACGDVSYSLTCLTEMLQTAMGLQRQATSATVFNAYAEAVKSIITKVFASSHQIISIGSQPAAAHAARLAAAPALLALLAAAAPWRCLPALCWGHFPPSMLRALAEAVPDGVATGQLLAFVLRTQPQQLRVLQLG